VFDDAVLPVGDPQPHPGRPDVDEVDVDVVDPGREVRQRVQPRLTRAPVVVGLPVPGQLLDRGQLHALGPVPDQLGARPAHHGDPPAQLGQIVLRDLDPEPSDPRWPQALGWLKTWRPPA